jgi:hypothetical protein
MKSILNGERLTFGRQFSEENIGLFDKFLEILASFILAHYINGQIV